MIFGYLLFFADSAERATTQAMLMGSVTVVITLLMLLLTFFDNPHGEGIGGLQPTAMQRSLRIIDTQVDALGLHGHATVRRAGQRPLSTSSGAQPARRPPAVAGAG